MKDLKASDCTYDNSFPANIEWSKAVVVQIPSSGQGVVLYTCKIKGRQASCYLPLDFKDKYTNDMYLFRSGN